MAFDLDGTLYPNYRLYFRLIPGILAHPRFLGAFAAVRRRFHSLALDPVPGAVSFYEEQAALMGEILGEPGGRILKKTERLIYRGWEGCFSRIRLFPGVRETLRAFRGAGLKLALLSDFPPWNKIALLGLEGFFDVLLASEKTGRLKPSPLPFNALASSLALNPQEILYVGNSPRYDAAGSLAAGMRAALIRRSPLSTGCSQGTGGAELIFRDYRQLQEYVLG